VGLFYHVSAKKQWLVSSGGSKKKDRSSQVNTNLELSSVWCMASYICILFGGSFLSIITASWARVDLKLLPCFFLANYVHEASCALQWPTWYFHILLAAHKVYPRFVALVPKHLIPCAALCLFSVMYLLKAEICFYLCRVTW